MENYDALIENMEAKQSKQPEHERLSTGEWVAKKQEERAAAYELVEKTAEKAFADPKTLESYLGMQARLGRASVNNALLAVTQKPDASYLLSFEEWQEKGRSVKRGEKAIVQLAANGEYEREDGSLGMNIDVKRTFDVSQTHGKPINKRAALTMPIRAKLKALMTDAPVPIRLSDGVPQSIGALYSKENGVIEVARGMEANALFFTVARELARAESGAETFICDCAANIACERFGVPAMMCDKIPHELSSLDIREKRSVLGIVRETACDITERVDRNLYAERQQQRNQPER